MPSQEIFVVIRAYDDLVKARGDATTAGLLARVADIGQMDLLFQRPRAFPPDVPTGSYDFDLPCDRGLLAKAYADGFDFIDTERYVYTCTSCDANYTSAETCITPNHSGQCDDCFYFTPPS